MRFTQVLLAASTLAGYGLADIKSIRNAMFDVKAKVEALDKSVEAWPGTLISGGDMLCKTIELRKSLTACTRAIESSEALQEKDFRNPQNALPFVRLFDSVFQLKDQAVRQKPKLDRIGATPVIFEVMRAQRDPASELSKTMATMIQKMPASFKNQKIKENLISGPELPLEQFVRTVMDKVFDKELRDFEPPQGQIDFFAQPLAQFVLLASKFSESIDAGPFCKTLPPLMNFLSAQKDVGLGTLTDKVLEILESTGAQDAIPLDIIKKNLEVFGIPGETVTKALDMFGVPARGLPLRTFTQAGRRIIQDLNLRNLVVNPSMITSFVNTFVENTVGLVRSFGQANAANTGKGKPRKKAKNKGRKRVERQKARKDGQTKPE
ncbi:hypothetical protein HIM_10799 [Hirsutella minnesotensis 3608]|uniref:Uncharacterized protein n=1 Tax=Hirsutella minnesotensis 3608 TaxID=1043627 RepID=A0A0F7ZJP8_9HYPO|nr:hypothetical protein HIM_10799 [Hirsutella minnesotensis 3608]